MNIDDLSLLRTVETGTGGLRLNLSRRLAAEALGTSFLVLAVIGSGIMADRTSAGEAGLQLFENAAATAVALAGLILMFREISGAHFNPAVTLLERMFKTITTRDAILYISVQIVGGCAGAVLANVMFGLPAIAISTQTRSSVGLWLAETVATVGLLLLIQSCVRTNQRSVLPFAVGGWIGGAYWFTASTSFANPAVTIARTLSDSFAGIAPASVPPFIAMQLIGTLISFGLIKFFYPPHRPEITND